MKRMKKPFKITVSIVLSVMCILLGIPTASATFTDDLVAGMTLEEKIGQMLILDVSKYNGTSFTAMKKEVADIFTEKSLGGVILFSENLEDTQQTVQLISDFQNAALASRNQIPLFVSIDQEGGEVVRLKQGTSLPGNMALGATNSEEDCQTAGNIIGRELSALGFNMDFAPSLDVNSNPLNPIIGLRSYSSDPELVGRLGMSTVTGIQKNNVVAVVKHFPGHGDTSTDSHVGLPVVSKSMTELEKCELVPFKKAIDSGVDMIMTAHIQFPQIENTKVKSLEGDDIILPATLSKKIITDLLRNEMGFKGVVTTDAMNMSAISENFGVTQACVLAINAGVDMLLMPISISSSSSKVEISSLIGNIVSAVRNGVIQEETINDAVRRIIELKQKKNMFAYRGTAAAQALSTVGSVQNHEAEDDISTKAITVLKNDNNMLPLKPTNDQKAVFVMPYADERTNCQFAMSKLVSKKAIPEMEYETYCYHEGSSVDEICYAIDSADYVFVFTEMSSPMDILPNNISTSVPKQVISYAREQSKTCIVTSIGNPYDVANYTDVPALLVAYGCKGMDSSDTDGSLPATYTYGPNIMAAIEVAFGYKNPYGVLPVDVPVINADGSMNLSELAFKLGSGMIYPETKKEEKSTSVPTEIKIDVSDEVAPSIDNRNIIQKLKDNGSLPVVILLSVAIIVVIVVLIAVVSGKKTKKPKN